MHGQQLFIHLTVIFLAGTACVTDILWRRVPNPLVIAGLGLGIGLNAWSEGLHGLVMSLAGAVLGMALFLPFFALGGMGAGDVKLLAALGSLLGPGDLVRTALAGAVAGGLMALAVAAYQRRLLDTFRGIGRLLSYWASGGLRPSPELNLGSPVALKIPYAVPVAAGAVLIVLSRWSSP
jgi:prepilin peptidase CpaA